MSLQTRMVLYASLLIVLTVAAIGIPMALQTRQAILRQAEIDGLLVARVMAQTAAVATTIPVEIEDTIGRLMVSEALIAAHLADVAELAGLSPDEINARLMEIAARSTLGEIWITDETGNAYLRNLVDVDYQFSPNREEQPLNYRFWPLLTGEKFSVTASAAERSLDGRVFKYAGVRGVDSPRIVQVGYEFDFIKDLSDRIGLKEMVRSLMGSGNVNAVWVLDGAMVPLASETRLQTEVADDLTASEEAVLRDVIQDGFARSWLVSADLSEPTWYQELGWLQDMILVVAAPIPGTDGLPIGATLLRLPTDELQRATITAMTQVGIISAVVLIVGIILSAMVAGRLSRPMLQLTTAASAVERKEFDPGTLKDLHRRSDEIGRMARVFTNMAKVVLEREERLDQLVRERTAELVEKNTELEKAQAQINSELEVAQHMQQTILPSEFPEHPNWAGYAEMTAARQVGGDFYDFFQLDDHRIGVVMADVSGKGVPAAFFMAVARTVLQAEAMKGGSPGQVMEEANNQICRDNPLELFVTVFYGILDARTGEFHYANAGHNAPMLVDRAGTITELEGTGGMALGVLDEMPYEEARLHLADGDTVFLFTDGVTEAFNEAGEEFTEPRLMAALEGGQELEVDALAKSVVATVKRFAGAAPQSDDLTCLSLRFVGGSVDLDEDPATEPMFASAGDDSLPVAETWALPAPEQDALPAPEPMTLPTPQEALPAATLPQPTLPQPTLPQPTLPDPTLPEPAASPTAQPPPPAAEAPAPGSAAPGGAMTLEQAIAAAQAAARAAEADDDGDDDEDITISVEMPRGPLPEWQEAARGEELPPGFDAHTLIGTKLPLEGQIKELKEIRLANQLPEIHRLSGEIEAFAERNTLPAGVVYQVTLALDELITNIVSYGYEDDDAHEIVVRLTLDADVLMTELIDDARAFNPLAEAAAPDLDADVDARRIGGLGVHFVKTMMNAVEYARVDGRNTLTMMKKVEEETED